MFGGGKAREEDAPLTVGRLRAELEVFAKGMLQQEVRLALEQEIHKLREETTKSDSPPAVSQRLSVAPAEPPAAAVMRRRDRKGTKPADGENGVAIATVLSPRTLALEPTEQDVFLLAGDAPQDASRGGHGWLADVVHSSAYRAGASGMLIINAAWLGVQTDYTAKHYKEEAPSWFCTMDQLFCIFFMADLTINIVAKGCAAFFTGRNHCWNWFDFLMVSMQVIETVFLSLSLTARSGTAGVFRLLRMIRVIRVARVFHALTSLRKLVVSVFYSMQFLLWPMIMIFLLTYIHGMFFTQVVTEHKMSLSDEELEGQEALEEFFGRLGSSMLVLFQTVSDGIHWCEVLESLAKVGSPWLVAVFIVYISFVVFAMMNVITAFFVESTLAATERDHREQIIQHLIKAFPVDAGGHSRGISEDEFNAMLDSEPLEEYLQALELTPDDAREAKFFQVLDMDSSGSIEPSEVVDGCQRLIGNARALDLATLAFSFRTEVQLATKHRHKVETLLKDALTR
mmetsp:Transcript_28895/g.65345  ORF Transcript_28895/g.65345 Transcript_28895/m.65345 type:complete len:512 (+) Transcript_28895:46-1581(+)